MTTVDIHRLDQRILDWTSRMASKKLLWRSLYWIYAEGQKTKIEAKMCSFLQDFKILEYIKWFFFITRRSQVVSEKFYSFKVYSKYSLESILFQCSTNSLCFSGNSKNRAGHCFFFFLTKWQHRGFVCWRCCSLFDGNIVYTTHKTSVLSFCEKEKKAAIQCRRRILRLEKYAKS